MNNQDIHISLEEWEEIEAYLNGSLSTEQLQVFEQRLQSENNLFAKVEKVKLSLLTVEEAGLRADLETFHARLKTKPVVSITTHKKNNLTKWLAIAAVFIAIAVTTVLYLQQPNEHEKIYSSFYKPDPGLSTTMSETDNYEFEKAMVDYKTGNYEKALAVWQNLLKQNPQSDTLNYFVGNALLAEKNEKVAIKHFESVLKYTNSGFIGEAYWFLGLIYLKNEEREKAIEYLQKSNLAEATVLLKQLE